MDFGVKRPLFGKEIPMRTVNEVSKLTGVSIRTLQYYDSIGLLKPTEYTEVGYRLYDEEALERLQQILLFRELEFPLKEIKDIIYNPKFNKIIYIASIYFPSIILCTNSVNDKDAATQSIAAIISRTIQHITLFLMDLNISISSINNSPLFHITRLIIHFSFYTANFFTFFYFFT